MAEQITTLTIGKAEALVLFEILADYHNQPCIEARTSSDKFALVRLHGALEKALVEPFMPDYQSLVDKARSELAIEAGVA